MAYAWKMERVLVIEVSWVKPATFRNVRIIAHTRMGIVIMRSIDAFAHMDLQEATAVKSGLWASGKWSKRPKISYSDPHHMHQLVTIDFIFISAFIFI